NNIAGLTLDGGVHKILAGGSISNVTAANAMEIRNGTAAGLQSFNFNAAASPPSLLAFTPADGTKGGDITNIAIGTALNPGTAALTIHMGDGGNSSLKNGGDAGKFDHVTIFNDDGVSVMGGKGGDGLKKG